MNTLFMSQTCSHARHGSITVKPVCLWALALELERT